MLKKIITAAAAIVILAAVSFFNCEAADISAQCAILYEAGSGKVLFEKEADKPMLIASTTKIMTALVALENSLLSDTVTVPKICESIEGSSMYLKAGEKLSMRELLYGLMLESGNDAAVAVAHHIAGDVETFAEMMNSRAQEIGCINTQFKNPNGLDAEGHYSCARDMALIMAEAMKNELFEQIVSTKSISFGSRTFTNHNKLLEIYDGTTGGKTGYTKSAGRTLVSCAERDGMRLICVTLNDPCDWEDHIALFDEGFSKWIKTDICSAEETASELPVISGELPRVSVRPEKSVSLLLPTGTAPEVTLELPEFVYADVKKGDVAGYLVYKNGTEEERVPLLFSESVKRSSNEKLTPWEKILRGLIGVLDVESA